MMNPAGQLVTADPQDLIKEDFNSSLRRSVDTQ